MMRQRAMMRDRMAYDRYLISEVRKWEMVHISF
jgi:hypothetical protein